MKQCSSFQNAASLAASLANPLVLCKQSQIISLFIMANLVSFYIQYIISFCQTTKVLLLLQHDLKFFAKWLSAKPSDSSHDGFHFKLLSNRQAHRLECKSLCCCGGSDDLGTGIQAKHQQLSLLNRKHQLSCFQVCFPRSVREIMQEILGMLWEFWLRKATWGNLMSFPRLFIIAYIHQKTHRTCVWQLLVQMPSKSFMAPSLPCRNVFIPALRDGYSSAAVHTIINGLFQCVCFCQCDSECDSVHQPNSNFRPPQVRMQFSVVPETGSTYEPPAA